MISGNMVGSYSSIGKTFILVDDDGNEITGVCVDNPVVFTAGDNDVREGFVYAGDSGVSTGTKDIPAYYSNFGTKILSANQEAVIYMPKYNYENLIVTISTYNTSPTQSLDVTYVSVYDGMYAIGDSTKLSNITMDEDNQQIKLGITVSKKSVLRYSIITEEI